jgi:hypothetical protein
LKLRKLELFAVKKKIKPTKQNSDWLIDWLIDASPDPVCWIVIPIDGKANPSLCYGEIPPFK